MSLTWSKTPKTGFLLMRLISCAASIGLELSDIRFWGRSNQNCGCNVNRKLPLTLDDSDLCHFGHNSDLSYGRFGPWMSRTFANSDLLKTMSELAELQMKIRSELAKLQMKIRSELAIFRIELRSELTMVEIIFS